MALHRSARLHTDHPGGRRLHAADGGLRDRLPPGHRRLRAWRDDPLRGARRARVLLPDRALPRRGRAIRRPRGLRAADPGLPCEGRRSAHPHRRRGRRRPPRPARDHAQPGARPQPGRLRRRRSAQAAPAGRRGPGARDDRRAGRGARRDRARRGDDRDPVRARDPAGQGRQGLPGPRHSRADHAHGLRTAAGRAERGQAGP